MAGIERLVPTNQLKTTLLMSMIRDKQPHQVYSTYERNFDAFIFLVVPPDTDTVAHYIDDYVALLYRADDNEVVGFQVEAFKHSFLPKHANVERVWRLSDSGVKFEDVFEMELVAKREKRNVAQEVLKATEDVLGEPGKDLTELLEFA